MKIINHFTRLVVGATLAALLSGCEGPGLFAGIDNDRSQTTTVYRQTPVIIQSSGSSYQPTVVRQSRAHAPEQVVISRASQHRSEIIQSRDSTSRQAVTARRSRDERLKPSRDDTGQQVIISRKSRHASTIEQSRGDTW